MNHADVDRVILRVERIHVANKFHKAYALFSSPWILCLADCHANLLCIFFYNYKKEEILPVFLVEL
jgi:hypothetical protein